MQSQRSSTAPMPGRRVAITGIGALSPNGAGRASYWDSLAAGRSGLRKIEGFDTSAHPTRIAGQILDFDPASVIEGKELKHIPRAVAMSMAASDEALADAGLELGNLSIEDRRRFGVVIGSGGVGLEFTERQFRTYYLGDPKAVSLYTIPSSTPGSMSSELSMRYDLRGPSHVLSTGCTSSTDAIGHAFSLIRYGRADRVLTGGADCPIAPGILTGFCLMRVMTSSWNEEPQRASRPFSADRDGFVVAEGSWMLVLESWDHAVDRGATIYAELLGYGSTCEAFHRVRLDESGEEPARAMALAMEDAGVPREEIDYINVHGTSTLLNDRVETRAVRRALGPQAEKTPISSTKSMIGHPQGACGAAGLTATLLGMRHRTIPPTINHETPDPQCDLDVVPNSSRKAEFRTAICNTIGFGSKNSALVVRAES